ncbi:MAG: hypothetical protein ACI4MN_04165 [Candidatus Coproplasma sp.]
MNDERRENLFKKLARVIPKSKRDSLKSALDEADDGKVEMLEKVKLQRTKSEKKFRSIVSVFGTALGVIMLVLNMVFTMAISPIYQRCSTFSIRISGEMQQIYSNTANYGNINPDNVIDVPSDGGETASADTIETLSAIERVSGNDVIFNEITNGLFEGCEYSDFKVLLDNYYDYLTDLETCRNDYNTAKNAYFSDANYVNNKTNNYLKYVVALNSLTEPDEGKEQAYQNSIQTYEEKRDGLTEKYNILTEKYNALENCLQNCTNARQLMCDFIVNNESAMVDELRVALYSNDSEIKNYGALQYLKNCLQALDNYNSVYTVEMDKYSADSTAYTNAVDGLAELNVDYEKKYLSYQTAINDFSGFTASYVSEVDDYYVALNANDEERSLEIANSLSYSEYVLTAFGLNSYISAIRSKTQSVKTVETLQQELVGETDAEKIYSINSEIEKENQKISDAQEIIDEANIKIALIDEMLTSNVWTDEYYSNMCVTFNGVENPTDEEKAEFELKKGTYETVQNALISLSARVTEKQNIFTQQVQVSTLPYNIKDDEFNSIVAYYNTEHTLLKLQSALNLVPDLVDIAADGYKKIIDNVDNAMFVDNKTHERVLNDLSLEETYAYLRNYSNTAQTVELETLLFDEFDINDLVTAESHTIISNEYYKQLTKEVSAFDSATASVSSTQSKASQLTHDYYFAPNYIYMFLMVVDIVVAVIAACYFAYLLYAEIIERKEEYYEIILDMLAE